MLSRENEHELCSFCRFSGIIICGPNRSEKGRHLCRWDEHIRRNPSQNAAFFTKREHTIKWAIALSSPVSTAYARNAWVFTLLLPSFSQSKNVWKFRDVVYSLQWRSFKVNLASLQQVSSPNSQDNFQICCADVYLVRFLANFACFCLFLWILRIYLKFAAPRLRKISETLLIRPCDVAWLSHWQSYEEFSRP